MCMMRPVDMTIVIVDDHAAFRRAARDVLRAEGLDVVGEAADGAEALAEVARLAPGLVLLDIQLPDMDGFEVAERLAESPRPPAVILISSRESEQYGDRVARATVRGYIAKSRLSGAAIRAILG
jgi:DNA-binding NarL/FixJ family response regulator